MRVGLVCVWVWMLIWGVGGRGVLEGQGFLSGVGRWCSECRLFITEQVFFVKEVRGDGLAGATGLAVQRCRL